MLTKYFNDMPVKLEGEWISLTDLWKASGSKDTQKPYEWSRLPESQKFIGAVATKLNTELSRIIHGVRGRNGGTFAHKQIALAYAKYLSPELHMFVNEVFFERLEEEANPELALVRGT